MKAYQRFFISMLVGSLFLWMTITTGCGTTVRLHTGAAEEAASEERTGEEGTDDADTPETGAEDKTSSSNGLETAPQSEEPTKVCVYVCGAVRQPGVYELPSGSRVVAALEAAGGCTEEAEIRSLNQAQLLADGEQITVWTVEEMAASGTWNGPGSAEAAASESGRVNLNTASKEDLMTLPGIGEARAAAILAYRDAHGSFTAIEELMQIDGIKEKAFAKIKELIEV